MSITAAEVGRLAGCSTATVSRALNNTGSVSARTREAIQRALRETHYLPKQTLRQRKAAAAVAAEIGTLVEIVFHRHSLVEHVSMDGHSLNIDPPGEMPASALRARAYQLSLSFHRQIIEGAIAELSRWGNRSVLQINHDLKEPQFLADLNKPDKCGVLLVGEENPDVCSFARECRHPLVLVDFIREGGNDVVTIDNFGGVMTAFDHLHALGHRRIGFVGFRADVPQYRERFLAYKLKLAEAGLAFNPAWIYCGFDHIETAAPVIGKLLAGNDRPTAILCASDIYAVSVIRAANNLGIDIPGQLSVVGFDDIDLAAMVTPALTTVHVPQAEMGKQAARQLMIATHFHDPERTRGCEVRVKTELVVRASTAAVAMATGAVSSSNWKG